LDEAIGWQAGNWEVNRRSIGICINDDLTDKPPSEAALASVGQILRSYNDRFGQLEVVGHREVNPKTLCPGDKFLTGWKSKLLEEE
jgi:N-acetyl-anhydromuramyl-L-alanine amidase AmpD